MTPAERKQLISEIAEVIQVSSTQLNEEEQRWVRLAIKKEGQAIAMRQAVIEKTLGGLVWASFLGIGYLILDFFKSHGVRLP